MDDMDGIEGMGGMGGLGIDGVEDDLPEEPDPYADMGDLDFSKESIPS